MGEARDSLNATKRRTDAVGPGVQVTWESRDYTVHYGEVSATIALELRRQAGFALREVWRQLGDGETDVDTIAIIIWLARRVGGEQLTLAEVLEQVTSDVSTFTFREVDATSDPKDPVVEDGEPISPNV